MDEKDRTIVTFGGDPEPEKVSQSSGFASGQDELRVDVEIPQEVKPEVNPYKDTVVGADTGDYLEDYKTYVDRYNAEHSVPCVRLPSGIRAPLRSGVPRLRRHSHKP